MTSSEKPQQFGMKSQLILNTRRLFTNNQKLVDLLLEPLTRKYKIWGDAYLKSLSIVIFHFGFEGGTLVLIASVPGHSLYFTFSKFYSL